MASAVLAHRCARGQAQRTVTSVPLADGPASTMTDRPSRPPFPSSEPADTLIEGTTLQLALRAVAQGLARGDAETLRELLEGLLAEPIVLFTILDRACRDELGTDPRVRAGACVTLVAAAQVAAHPAPGDTRRPKLEGREFLLALLRTVPRLPGATAELLVERLARARVVERASVERALVEPDVLEELVRIVRRDAHSLRVLAPLLVTLADNHVRGAAHATHFERLLADVDSGCPSEPRVLRAAASVLLIEEPDLALRWAAARHDRHDTTRAARMALRKAVARAAPPEAAARWLARVERSSSSLASLEDFAQIARRPGGRAALEGVYNELLSRPGPTSRVRSLVVAVLGEADPTVLLGIAATDPDPITRGQALLTATAVASPTHDALVVAAAASGSGAHGGLRIHDEVLALAVSNLVRRGSPSLRSQAQRLLLTIGAPSPTRLPSTPRPVRTP